MKKILLFLLPFCAFSQHEYLDLIELSYPSTGVTPSGVVWTINDKGEAYYTDDVKQPWKHISLNEHSPYGGFRLVTSFSDNVLMISGSMGKNNDGFILRSEDGGKTWDKVYYGVNSLIDEVYADSNGRAWMAGSSNRIYFTEDTGKTWKDLGPIANDTDLRPSSIHFMNDGKTGLFCDSDGILAFTPDNCKTWQRLPTPVSQGKLVSADGRYYLRETRFFGDYYVLRQDDSFFITLRSDIDWKLLEHVVRFEVCGDHAYLVNAAGTVTLKDKSFTTVWQSPEKLPHGPGMIIPSGKTFFMKTGNYMYKISPTVWEYGIMAIEGSTIDEPYKLHDFKGYKLGFDDDMLLKYDDIKGKWFRYMELPFEVRNFSSYNNSLVLGTFRTYDHYTIDLEKKSVDPFTFPLTLFKGKKIKSMIVIEGGSDRYMWDDEVQLVFTNEKGKLKASPEKNETRFAAMDDIIPEKLVWDILNEADACRNRRIQLDDFKFSRNDLKAYKKLIDIKERQSMAGSSEFDEDELYEFWNGADTDFDFYRSVADSLDKITPEQFTEIFEDRNRGWRTHATFNSLKIEFEDGTAMEITSQNYNPNHFSTPMLVEYDGLAYLAKSVKLGQYLDILTKKTLLEQPETDKVFAIFQIAGYLYAKSLGYNRE